MVTLNINGVECSYGSLKILSDVNLIVEPGEFVGILGPNGSGKSTLLKSVSRVLEPQGGSILIDKADIYALKPVEVAKQMAVVPQESMVGFNFSVMDVVLMGRNPHMARFDMETPQDVQIAKTAMELTNTWRLSDRSIYEISGGERQRVIIARALTQQPKILILDEPTTYLDIVNQIEIMDLLKRLCISGKLTVLAAVHDLNMAARYCNKLVLLKDGKVYSAGNIEDVLTRENILTVYEVQSVVKRNVFTDSLYVIPLTPQKHHFAKEIKVHIICGAGTGTLLIKLLVDEGYSVTAGVLSPLDLDFETCQLFKINAVTDAPYSSITNKASLLHLEMISKADAVVLTSVPFGLGNLRNLENALEALKRGITTYVVDEVPVESRDFTGGKAAALMAELKQNGALFVKRPYDLLPLLNVSIEKTLTRAPSALTETYSGAPKP